MLIVPPPSPELTRGLSATLPLLLHGPRLPDGRIADVMVADGVIVSVGDDSAGRLPSHVMDLRGYLLLPSLVEPHAHLRLTAPVTRPGEAGARTAPDRDRWVAAPADLTPADVATRAWNGAARYLAAGTTAIRVHVDIGQESGLRAVEALAIMAAGAGTGLDLHIGERRRHARVAGTADRHRQGLVRLPARGQPRGELRDEEEGTAAHGAFAGGRRDRRRGSAASGAGLARRRRPGEFPRIGSRAGTASRGSADSGGWRRLARAVRPGGSRGPARHGRASWRRA